MDQTLGLSKELFLCTSICSNFRKMCKRNQTDQQCSVYRGSFNRKIRYSIVIINSNVLPIQFRKTPIPRFNTELYGGKPQEQLFNEHYKIIIIIIITCIAWDWVGTVFSTLYDPSCWAQCLYKGRSCGSRAVHYRAPHGTCAQSSISSISDTIAALFIRQNVIQ